MGELSATDPHAPARIEPVRTPSATTAGTRIGRYRVLERLGAGGMGEVYRARDDELDRDVAIKVLRGGIAGAAREKARERMLREARAMAQLAHPNVVTVFEAGTVGEHVFIAMELVQGRTLRADLAGRRRTWRDIVARFSAAGRGLAAAHRASIVHRDFKPDNVLVGLDGRVRVTDFGLAGIGAQTDDDDDPADGAETAAATPAGELPTLDAIQFSVLVAGTPAYMAPEQHEGRSSDARADQFAFCVALYEALYRERPFAGDDYKSLRAAVVAGDLRAAPPAAAVPAWIRALLARGLSTDPEQRFPSMDALLEVLEHDPAARRRRLLAWIGVPALVAAAAVGGTMAARRSAAPSCGDARARLAGRWDAPARARVVAAFGRSGLAFAPELADRVVAMLDRYADAWVTMRTEACEATNVRHEQSAALLDLRIACLDRRAGELGALAAVLGSAGGDAIGHAPEAVVGLTSLAGCDDPSTLTAVVAPADPAQRPAIARAYALLDRAGALERSGDYAAGIVIARVASALVRPLDYAPLTGEACYAEAKLVEGLGDLGAARAGYEAAAEAAAAGRDDRTAAAAWTNLIHLVGIDQARLDEAVALLPAARAAIARLGGDPKAEMALLTTSATILGELGRLDEALADDRRAVAIADQDLDADEPGVAQAHNNLAMSLFNLGQLDDALAEVDRGLAIARAGLGEHHPVVASLWGSRSLIVAERGDPTAALADLDKTLAIRVGVFGPDSRAVADTLINRGNLLDTLGRPDEARAELEHAIAIEERTLGSTHPNVAIALSALGQSIANRHDDQAIPLFERALAIFEQRYGPDSLQAARVHANLAGSLAAVGRLDDAERHGRAALATMEKHYGADSPDLVPSIYALADIRFARGDAAGALSDLERARGILERHLGASHPNLAAVLTTIGEMQLERGQPAAAVAPLERALAIYEPIVADIEASRVAGTRFALAQALWATGGDRTRALALARAARAGFPTPDFDQERADVDAWLAKHRR